LDIEKSVLRGKFIAMSTYVKRIERSNQWPNATSQTPWKTRTSKSQNKQDRNNKNMGWN
jgi:hypothetical protein